MSENEVPDKMSRGCCTKMSCDQVVVHRGKPQPGLEVDRMHWCRLQESLVSNKFQHAAG